MFLHPMYYDISAFNILKTLGTGLFGKVYLVRNSKAHLYDDDEFVACKIVAKPPPKEKILKEYLKREIETFKILQNGAFFPKFHAVLDVEKKICIFMELCEGGELYDRVKYNVLDVESIRFYAAEILMALKYMHERDIIHRDLKLENVLLTKNGHIKIVDFGVSAHIEDIKHMRVGSYEYMSPEVLGRKEYSHEADLWSLGIVLYTMFYRNYPFNIADKMRKDKNKVDVINYDLVFCDPIDIALKDLIEKLLEKNMDKRLICIYEIMKHEFFKGINWVDVMNLKLKPPFIPTFDHNSEFENLEEVGKDGVEFLTFVASK